MTGRKLKDNMDEAELKKKKRKSQSVLMEMLYNFTIQQETQIFEIVLVGDSLIHSSEF